MRGVVEAVCYVSRLRTDVLLVVLITATTIQCWWLALCEGRFTSNSRSRVVQSQEACRPHRTYVCLCRCVPDTSLTVPTRLSVTLTTWLGKGL